jgi:hypothetical protein
LSANLMTTCEDWCSQIQTGQADADDVLRALDFLAQLKAATKKMSEDMESAVVGWIGTNGDLTSGDIRYYVAPNKTTKCKDLRATLEAVLELGGGNLDAVFDCLSTSAFKPAKTKALLGEKADDLFETTETLDLKTGKPKGARLQKHDPKFCGDKEAD